MRAPFILFCSPADKGLSHSSLDDQTLLPYRSLNSANTHVAVNAATGNTFIKDTVFSINDHDAVLNIGMVFNSSDQRWRLSLGSRLSSPGAFHPRLPQWASAEIITLTEEDGRTLQYQYDNTDGRYYCLESSQADAGFLMKSADNTLTRFFAETGINELYDKTGKLIRKTLLGNLSFAYYYDRNDQIKVITLPSGRELSIETEIQDKRIMSLHLTGLDHPIAVYELDKTGLTTKITQEDKTPYVTTYLLSLDGSLLQISSADETKTILTFNKKSNVTTLLQGRKDSPNSQEWYVFLDKKQKQCELIDGDKNVYRLTVDNNQHLKSFQLPTDDAPKNYSYNRQGQLLSITDPDHYKRSFYYEDGTGLLTRECDEFNTKSTKYIYHQDSQSLLFGAKIAEIRSEDSTRIACFFVYNDQRQCVYEISSEGRAKRFYYSDTSPSHLIAIKKDPSRFYNLDRVNLDQPETYPTPTQMHQWWEGLTKEQSARLQVTTFTQDAYGRKNSETNYTIVDEQGNGVPHQMIQIQHTLDEMGRAIITDVATDTEGQPVFSRTKTKRDYLNRIKETREEGEEDRVTQYHYEGNTTEIIHANGLVEKHCHDEGRLLVSIARGDEHQSRTQDFSYYTNGAIKKQAGEDGRIQYNFCDASGRSQYVVMPDGILKEISYDVRGKISCIKEFFIPDLDPADPNIDIKKLIAENKRSRNCYFFYDEDEQLRFEVTAKYTGETLTGSLTQHTYEFGQRTRTIRYHLFLQAFELTDLSYASLNRAMLESDAIDQDREIRYFHDKDGLLIGEQSYVGSEQIDQRTQFLGFLTAFKRDGAGNSICQIQYLDKCPLMTTLTLQESPALETWYWQDNAGRKIAKLDAGYRLTAYTYYADSKIKEKIRYADKKIININDRAITLPLADEKDHVVSYMYDAFRRERSVIDSSTGLQILKNHDAADNETSKILHDTRSHQLRKTYQAHTVFSEVKAAATARIADKMLHDADTSHWITYHRHPMTGLILSMTDALGQTTLYYYGKNREVVFEVRADGAVIHTDYDFLARQVALIYRYDQRLTPQDHAVLLADTTRSGFYELSIFEKLLQKSAQDEQHSSIFDTTGLLIKETDKKGAVHLLQHNPFGEIEWESQQVDDNKYQVRRYLYDLLGRCTRLIIDPDELQVVTTKAYDDVLGRLTESTDELGAVFSTSYIGLRKRMIKDMRTPGRYQIITQDTFMRDLTISDWSGNHPVVHAYDDKQGKHTVSLADGNTVLTEIRNAFNEIESELNAGRLTNYVRGVDGQAEETIYPEGTKKYQEYDLNGLLFLEKSCNGKITIFSRDTAGFVLSITEEAFGEKRVARLVPNVFGVNEVEERPDGLIINRSIKQGGLIEEIVQDKNELQLRAEHTHRFDGSIKILQQGTENDPNQYREISEIDVLGRETARTIVGDNKESWLLKKRAWDAANHLLSSTDGKGNSERYLYDYLGNLRFTIDAEGFVTERTYDTNQREIIRCCYARALQEEEIQALSADYSRLSHLEDNDTVLVFFHDETGLLRYQWQLLERQGQQGIFSVEERRYNTARKIKQHIQYAKPMDADILSMPDFDAVKLCLQTPAYADHPRNRSEEVCRDKKGREVIQRDGENHVIEKQYDANDNVIATISYAEKLLLPSLPESIEDILPLLDKTHPDNRAIYDVYDQFDLLRFSVNSRGHVVSYQYDKANHCTYERYYFYPLTIVMGPDELNALFQQLGSAECDIQIKLNTMQQLARDIKNESKDSCLINEYDKAGRLIAKIDGENNKEIFKPNAIGLNEIIIDKRKQVWRKQFNRAKKLTTDISPAIDIAQIKQDQRLSVSILPEQCVENVIEYDEAFNSTSMVFAKNIPAEARRINNKFDKKDQFIGTEIENVQVDDGSADHPQKDKRPEKIVTLTTKRVLDHAGREIVSIDEKNSAQFTVFDLNGRERFRVDHDGYVTEFMYEDSFKEYTCLKQYTIPLSETECRDHLAGFSLAQLIKHVTDNKNSDTRSITFTRDRRGLVTGTKKDSIITAQISQEGDAEMQHIAPEKRWQHNAFGEVIIEEERINQTTFLSTYYFQDQCGNEILTVCPRGFVTETSYGPPCIGPDKKGSLILAKRAYKHPVPADKRQCKADMLAALDRTIGRAYEFIHDRRQLQTQLITEGDQPFYDTHLSPTGKLVRDAAKTRITTGTEYDEEGAAIAYSLDNGDKRYLQRNARGDVIAETEFPLAVDANDLDQDGRPKKHVPFLRHYVSAHKQVVGTRTYALPASDLINEPPMSEQDQTSLILMDNRGQAIVMQSSEGRLKFATYDECKQPVWSYHWVAGYQLRDQQAVLIDHLRGNRFVWNRRQQTIMQTKIDDEQALTIYKQINAFGECTEEGFDEHNMQIKRGFNQAGHQWFSNEEKGIATISFPNAKGDVTAIFRSQDNDLSIYKNVTEANLALLQVDYAAHIAEFQRTALLYDAGGNVQKQFTPWYRQIPKEVPQSKQVSFTVLDNPPGLAAGSYISWQGPEEKFLVADFKLRVKDNETWTTLTEILPPTKPDSPDQDRRYVNVSAYPSDVYEYQLDFYYADPEEGLEDTWPPRLKNCDPVPSYRAAGEVMLDTKNYHQSTHALWYLQDEHTLIIAGKLTDITGIELIRKNGSVYKRIAGTHAAENCLVVDLKQEESGLYDFKFVHGTDVLTDSYVVTPYQPYYQVLSNAVQFMPGSLPPEIVRLESDVRTATAGMPMNSFQLGKSDDKYTIGMLPGQNLTGAIIHGIDAEQKRYFLGQYFNTGHWQRTGMWHSFRADFPWLAGEAFFQIKMPAAGPHAVKIQASLYQLSPFAGGTYRAAFVPNMNQAAIVTLAQASTSSVIGSFSLNTPYHASTLTVREIQLNDFRIERYLGCAIFRSQIWDCGRDDYFHYRWTSNLPSTYRLQVAHAGIGSAIISDISALPRIGVHPGYYQANLSAPYRTTPGILNVNLIMDGDVIPIATNTAPAVGGGQGGRAQMTVMNEASSFEMQPSDISYYGNMYALYLSPLPAITASVELEVQINTSIGKAIWTKPIIQKTGLGVVIRPGAIQPGIYQYRIKAYDAAHEVLDLTHLGLSVDETGWHLGRLEFRRGLPHHQVFTSEIRNDVRAIVKPVAYCDYDRWRNPIAEISRSNYAKGLAQGNLEDYTEYKQYNLADQIVRVISPLVDHTDEKGKTEKTRLVHEYLFNTNNKKIGEILPAGAGEQLRLANVQGDTLMTQDEDEVRHRTVIDLFRRKISTEGETSGRTISSFSIKEELLIETRQLPNGASEERTFNQENRCVCYQDALKRNHYTDFDGAGRDILHINPDLTTQKQQFHPMSGTRTVFEDEDQNQQTWQTDDFGNVLAHTDFSGQVINYVLDFNKQITAEKGSLPANVKNRGKADVYGTPPPARDIVNIMNEAGLINDIVDAGANLITRIRRDLDEYAESYYFINNDGRVYQATYTDYDAMHRITQLRDTRYIVHIGYDKNSNRRFAKAHILGDDPHDEAFLRESWHTYTKANRPLLRDGMLKNDQIVLAPAQGTALTYEKGRINAQYAKTHSDELRIKGLSYRAGDMLTDVRTQEAGTGREIASMHRETDLANRCIELSQYKGCDVYVRATQPDSTEYVTYELPTFVLSLQTAGMGLYYYCKGQDPDVIIIPHDEKLYDTLIRFFGIPYDQIKEWQVLIMKDAILDFNRRVFGERVVDTTAYDVQNSIQSQYRKEKNGQKTNQRVVLEKARSGRVVKEENTARDHLTDEDETPYAIIDTIRTDYYHADSINVSQVTIENRRIEGDVDHDRLPKGVEVFTTEDANGMVTSVQGALSGGPDAPGDSFRHFVVNSQNCIVFKESAKGRNYYFYAEKRPGKTVLMAYFGDLPDNLKHKAKPPAVVNVDINHQALSPQYPPVLPADYRISSDMTYRQLAEELNYTGYAAAIAEANQADEDTLIKANTLVKIPPLYFEVADTAWNGSLPSIDHIIGSLYPIAPSPTITPREKSVKINWFETFLEAAAVTAILVFAPELFAGMMGATLGSATVASTASLPVAMAAYGGAGALASTVDQGIAMGFGSRKNFDLKSVAISTVSAAVSAGVVKGWSVHPDFLAITQSQTATNVIRAEGVALAQQAVLMSTNLQKRFDWRALSTAAFNAIVNTGADNVFGQHTSPDALPAADLAHATASPFNKVASAGVNTFVNTIGDAAIYQQDLSASGFSASVLGSMVGTYAGNSALDNLLARQQAVREEEKSAPRLQPKTTTQPKRPQPLSFFNRKESTNPVRKTQAERVQAWQADYAPGWEEKYRDEAAYYLADAGVGAEVANARAEVQRGYLRSIGDRVEKGAGVLYRAAAYEMQGSMLGEFIDDTRDLYAVALGTPAERREALIHQGEKLAVKVGGLAVGGVLGVAASRTLSVLASRGMFAVRGAGVEGIAESTSILQDILKTAKPMPGKSNQLEAILDDGTKVIFRRDIGEHAHPIGKDYPSPVDHYNVEIHAANTARPGKFIPQENVHIVVDEHLQPVDVFLKDKTRLGVDYSKRYK